MDLTSLVREFMIMITVWTCSVFLIASAFFMMRVAGILILKNKKSKPIERKEKIIFMTSIAILLSWILFSILLTKGFLYIHFFTALILTAITVKFIRIVQSL